MNKKISLMTFIIILGILFSNMIVAADLSSCSQNERKCNLYEGEKVNFQIGAESFEAKITSIKLFESKIASFFAGSSKKYN